MNQILTPIGQIPKPYNKKTHRIFHKLQLLLSIMLFVTSISFYYFKRSQSKKAQNLSQQLVDTFQISRIYSNQTNEVSLHSENTPNPYSIIGLIEIPKVQVHYPIISEVSDELLKISPCKFYGPAPNTIGNLCIAGHNYDNQTFFSDIPKLSLNDSIFIYDLTGKKVEYLIYEKFETTINDTSCTNQETNGKKIDPQGNATRAEAAAMLQNYCYYVKNSTQKDVDLMKYYAYPSKESEQNYDIYDEIEFQDNNKFIHRYKDYKNNYISENGTYKLTGTRVTLEYANNKTRYIIISNNNNIFEYDERYEIPVQKNKTYELNNSYRYLAMLTFENNNKFSLAYGVPNSGAISMLGTYKIEGANITFTVTQEGDEGGIFPVKSFKIKGILTADGKTVYLKVDTEDWRLVLE